MCVEPNAVCFTRQRRLCFVACVADPQFAVVTLSRLRFLRHHHSSNTRTRSIKARSRSISSANSLISSPWQMGPQSRHGQSRSSASRARDNRSLIPSSIFLAVLSPTPHRAPAADADIRDTLDSCSTRCTLQCCVSRTLSRLGAGKFPATSTAGRCSRGPGSRSDACRLFVERSSSSSFLIPTYHARLYSRLQHFAIPRA